MVCAQTGETAKQGKIVVKRDNFFKKLLYELPTLMTNPVKILYKNEETSMPRIPYFNVKQKIIDWLKSAS